MLTKDEAVEYFKGKRINCNHGYRHICNDCRKDIIALLKQPPAEQGRKIVAMSSHASSALALASICIAFDNEDIYEIISDKWTKLPPIPQEDDNGQ